MQGWYRPSQEAVHKLYHRDRAVISQMNCNLQTPLTYGERLGQLGLFSLEQRGLRWYLIPVHKYLMGRVKEREPGFSQWCQVTGQWAQTQIQGILFKHKKTLFYCEGGQMLEPSVCPEQLLILHPWRYEKPDWAWP